MPEIKTEKSIKKVAVIGAGVMGAGIAAQIANAGTPVLLLDIVPPKLKKGEDRSIIANSAVAKMAKAKPAPLMDKSFAKRITTGNTEDNLKDLKDCDWIIEAVIERLDIKQDLYAKIDKVRKRGAIVSSNTSTIPLEDLTANASESFKKHFLIAHFFNPPRYLRLLELVTSKHTDSKAETTIRNFADIHLGKSVVDCNDTPGFIANRIGTYWLHAAVTIAYKNNISVEQADAILSRPIGVPKTGVFGLLDLVGLDLMPHILGSLSDNLPKKDSFHKLGPAPSFLDEMVKEGYTGRKGKGGFYRLNTGGGKKIKEVRNLKTGEYSAAKRIIPAAVKASKKKGLRALITHSSPEGRYAWDVLYRTLTYAAELVPEIAKNIELVDRAMRLGYNWKYGPFELIDKIGAAWLTEQLKAASRPVPPILQKAAEAGGFYKIKEGKLNHLTTRGTYSPIKRPAGVLLLEDIKRASQPLYKNTSASIWDVGHGIACLEFHSKMNSLNPFIMWMIQKAIKKLPQDGFKGLVIYNEASNFSVGANIGMFMIGAKLSLWPAINWIVAQGQRAMLNMKQAPFPVVGAPSGMALGGGCEVILHCHAVEAHAETYIGLVEAGVGIVPGWGGCKELIGRWQTDPKAPKGPMYASLKAFETIATAQVATSAFEAKKMQFLRPTDGITMNRDRLLANAKERALNMAEESNGSYQPPQLFTFRLPGASGQAALMLGVNDFVKKGVASKHDAVIATELAYVLTGGKTDVIYEQTEADIMKLEREALVKLAKTEKSQARVIHMLKKGKPLRN